MNRPKFFRGAKALSREVKEARFTLVRRRPAGYVARMGPNRQTQAEALREVPAPQGEAGRRPETGHPERFCPNCSAELKENRCKLSCPRCGFYLSCSDFY